jgi:hypothetical protein
MQYSNYIFEKCREETRRWVKGAAEMAHGDQAGGGYGSGGGAGSNDGVVRLIPVVLVVSGNLQRQSIGSSPNVGSAKST